VQHLTSQPISLASLETLNTLLSSGILPNAGIDPAAVVRQYVQHGLRSLESSRGTFTTAAGFPEDSSEGYASGGGDALTPPGSADRESRARTVKLLVLFIKNLIRKGLVGPEELYYEIQEICVRYIWVREVREFRAFIEEGVE